MDRAIGDAAKQAVNRKMEDAGQRRATLRAALDALRDDATETAEGLAEAVRAAFDDAKRDFTAVATPAEFNHFIDRFVGPIEIRPDGTIGPKAPDAGVMAQKELPTTEVAGSISTPAYPTGFIAGGGFAPPTSGL